MWFQWKTVIGRLRRKEHQRPPGSLKTRLLLWVRDGTLLRGAVLANSSFTSKTARFRQSIPTAKTHSRQKGKKRKVVPQFEKLGIRPIYIDSKGLGGRIELKEVLSKWDLPLLKR